LLTKKVEDAAERKSAAEILEEAIQKQEQEEFGGDQYKDPFAENND